jgi:hypothetical protein
MVIYLRDEGGKSSFFMSLAQKFCRFESSSKSAYASKDVIFFFIIWCLRRKAARLFIHFFEEQLFTDGRA